MQKKTFHMNFQKFRPSEFMRARRPHLFSDAERVNQAQLDRATFEYHLETLTNRKQELDFEYFARKLAEKELCPNLLPQTGPTGGGDSKVDTETYPVSSDITERWYYGRATDMKGTTQRWAFAFSTKQDWKAKVRSDVKAIAESGRSYHLIYFITSRFAKDKDRASLEDELREAYAIDVRILDRTWITEKVFTNGREQLAVEALKLNPSFVHVLKKGPRDLTRDAELKELEQQIGDTGRYQGIEYQLVEDAMQAALVARSLELPRMEVDARLERASNLARKYGTVQQQLRSAYNKAWTLFWWYDDFEAFNSAYDDAERLATGSSQITDIVLLQNLWQLLVASVNSRRLDAGKARLRRRTNLLSKELQRLQSDSGRPTTALHARASQLLVNLTQAIGNEERLSQVLNDFQKLFEGCKGFINFPARHFIEMLDGAWGTVSGQPQI
jgi:hypothetical protein